MRQDLIAVYRQVVGGSGGFSTAAAAAQAPGGPPMPFDPEETIKEPSKGTPSATHITPPSGALARAPEPDDPTVISDSLPLATRAPAGLELVNFRDPSQRTGEAKAPDAAAASAAVGSGPGRNVWIGAALAAALVIAAGVFLLTRTRGATQTAAAPPREAPAPGAPAATAPIVFPAPQVGKDAAKETAGKPAPRAPAAAVPPAPAEKTEEKTAAKKPEAARAEPRARSFKVQFSSIPMATLYVDGKKIGPSLPAQVVELPQGKHTVRFEGADLPAYEKPFAVGEDGSPPIAYKFPLGSLVINAPAWAGANVLIDSKFKGILVGEKSFQLTAGSHHVTLSREGVNPYTGDVTVSEGEKKTLTPPAPTSTQESS
jgi:hypothetical protein